MIGFLLGEGFVVDLRQTFHSTKIIIRVRTDCRTLDEKDKEWCTTSLLQEHLNHTFQIEILVAPYCMPHNKQLTQAPQ